MIRPALLAACLLCAAPARSETDELQAVPAQAVEGRSYLGSNVPSQLRFINVRLRPVRLMWIGFDGRERQYGEIAPGQEVIQPTYVAHRWLVRDAEDGQPLVGFISTRSAIRDQGVPQIGLIR